MNGYIFIKVKMIVFLVCFSFQSFCMEEDPVRIAQCFFQQCKDIDKRYNQEWENVLKKTMHDNGLGMIDTLEEKLLLIKQGLKAEKKAFYNNLKIEYQIPDNRWYLSLILAKKLKNYYHETALLPLNGVVHDSAIPERFMTVLKTELLEEEFSPKRTHISLQEGSTPLISSVKIQWSYLKGVLTVKDIVEPGTIILDKAGVSIEDLDYMHAKCSLIAQQLNSKKCDKWFIHVLESYGIVFKPADSNNFERLCHKHALLRVVLNKPDKARCFKKFFNETIPSWFTIELYEQLSLIHLYSKVFENFKQGLKACDSKQGL